MSDTQELPQHASCMERSRAARRPLEQVRVLTPVCNADKPTLIAPGVLQTDSNQSPSCTVAEAAWSCKLGLLIPASWCQVPQAQRSLETCWHSTSLPFRPLQAAARHQTHLQAVKEPHKFAGEGDDGGMGRVQQCGASQKRKQVRLCRHLQTLLRVGHGCVHAVSCLPILLGVCQGLRTLSPPPRCMLLHLKPCC